MSEARFQRVSELFLKARALGLHERDLFLDEACGSDAELRREVALMLGAGDDALPFAELAEDLRGAREALSTQPICAPAGSNSDASRPSGSRIGPYHLLEKLGEGGFGVVYVAEQEQPVRRRVALKVIKLGMDTRQVVARFEAERQALAMMDHPHIAKVFDAGATDTGRPYFVMELVRGIPITHYCDQNNLSARQRLELFIPICQAVQHAHTKAVIHRDLKPSNVLVTLHDGQPVPKVIDFGIAKATAGRLTDKTIYTEFHAMIGTPAYMSPEQAELSGLDIDTRSDIYALGVLLYELLTGTTPFDATDLMRSGLAEMQRIIREVQPPKPSTRVSSLGLFPSPFKGEGRGEGGWHGQAQRGHVATRDAQHARASGLGMPPMPTASSVLDIAKHRRTDPQSLAKTIRGDLDWIVMKCLEKDRARRYETASALAADAQRYLAGEPVLAAPPSRVYRLRKLLRRYRLAVGIAAGFVALIAVGLVVSLTLWRGASAQRARAAAVSTFLTEMLTAAEPANAKGAKLTVREALDAAAKRIEEKPIKDQPLVEAEIRFTIGSTYFALGLYPQAETQLRAVDALQSRELGDDHPDTLRTRTKLAQALNRQSHFAGAAKLAEATMEAQRRILGPDHPDTLKSMMVLGAALTFTGRYADGVSLLHAAVDGRRRILGENHPDTAEAMNRLGMVYKNNFQPEKAEPLLRAALRIHTEVLGEDHPDTLFSMNLLAGSLYAQFRPEAAEPIYRRVLELSLGALGPEHTETLAARNNLAGALADQGRQSEAETLYRENLAARSLSAGPNDLPMITGKRDLADCLVRQRKYPEAETLLREALDAARQTYGPEHGDTSIRLTCALADVLAKQREDAEAEQVARQVLEFQHRQLPRPDLFEFGQSSSALVEVLKRRGANDEALRVERELIEFLLAAAHEADASVGTLHRAAKALLYAANEDLRDAPRALELELQVNERSGHQNPHFLGTLAKAYLRTGDLGRATEVWEQTMALLPDDRSRAALLRGAAWDLLNVTPETLRNPAAALPFALRANELSGHKNPADLDCAAWSLLTVTPETLRDPAAALEFALRANELSEHKNASHVDTLALAYFRTGDTLKAIEFEKQALELLPQDSSDRSEYEGRLAEFEAALENAGGEDRLP